MKTYDLLLDVGGTEIKMNALTSDGTFLLQKHQHAPAYAQESQATILAHFRSLLLSFIQEYQEEYQLRGIGLAFPGPFDYEKGISLMQGLRKYETIYGVNLREAIQTWLAEIGYHDVPIVFENDATCFALGEFHQTTETQKGIYLTLGTGCGSGLIEAGKIVKTGYGLNQMGMIYDTPFKEGIIDEYLSVNGLKKLAEEKRYPFINGKELAEAALTGNGVAQEVYQAFGLMIGEALNPFVASFQPQEIVFGGQISQSLPLFHGGILTNLAPWQPRIRRSEDTTTATLHGIENMIENTIRGE